MAENSKIEWTDHTASPWHGCTKVAAGCEHCYAATMSVRNPGTLGIWGDEGVRVKSKSFISNLEKWNREGEKAGKVLSVFPSLCDPFEDRAELAPWRAEMFEAADRLPWIRLLLLTKRPENIRRMWPITPCADCGSTTLDRDNATGCVGCRESRKVVARHGLHGDYIYRHNVWPGTSIATQADADRNIPELLKCRDLSPVLFVSAEPLLGPITLDTLGRGGPPRWLTCEMDHPEDQVIDWVIVGGESGRNARPMHPDWARALRDQCLATSTPFLFKQWGEWEAAGPAFPSLAVMSGNGKRYALLQPDGTVGTSGDGATPIARTGKKAAGRLLDGREWNEFPVTG